MIHLFSFWLGLMMAVAGCNYAENPANNLFVAIVIIYCGMGVTLISTIQLVKKGG